MNRLMLTVLLSIGFLFGSIFYYYFSPKIYFYYVFIALFFVVLEPVVIFFAANSLFNFIFKEDKKSGYLEKNANIGYFSFGFFLAVLFGKFFIFQVCSILGFDTAGLF